MADLTAHKKKWNELAAENDRYYVRSVDHEQSDEEYRESGRRDIEAFVERDGDLAILMQEAKTKSVIEIGCGSGRLTATLAERFGHVFALDISSVMLERAVAWMARDNISFVLSNGANVPLPKECADFAFSYIVYQHFPNREAIESSFRGVCNALKPAGLFKVQVRGLEHADPTHWSWGPHYTPETAERLAAVSGFRCLRMEGAGQRSLWLLLEKNAA